MPEPFTVAAVGALFGQLLTAIKEAVQTTLHFGSRLKSLQRILEIVAPIIKEIDPLNDLLDRPRKEMAWLHDLMKEGIKIVEESSCVTTVEVHRKHKYSKKLEELENGIIKFFHVYTIINSRDVKQVLVDVKEIMHSLAAIRKLSVTQESGSSNEGTVQESYKSCAVPKAPEFVVGFDVAIQQLKSQLLAEGRDEIVVSAPGGCGKTTLVKTVSDLKEIKGKFKDNIFFVTFTESPDFTAIVQDMIKHKGRDVPQIRTLEQGIQELQNLLEGIGENHPVLLIMDDVWSGSESLLENFLSKKIPDYKILATSRSDLSGFGALHKLEPLNDEDARKLFLHSATPNAGSIPGDKELIDEVVRRCKGSPLALTVVGKWLRGKHAEIWEARLRHWSKSSLVDSRRAILDCLQRSVADLDESHKEAFLDLGSFPEDHKIPAMAMIDMWIELHGLDVGGVDAKEILRELAARNLIDAFSTKGEDDRFYSYLYVRQHDLLRELAIHHNSQGPIQERRRLHMNIRNNKFPDWCTTPKD